MDSKNVDKTLALAIKAIDELGTRFCEIIDRDRRDLRSILPGLRSNYVLREQLRRWRQSARKILEEHFRQEETNAFEEAYRAVESSDGREYEVMVAYLAGLGHTAATEPELVFQSATGSSQRAPDLVGRVSTPTKRIFIVHGHDKENRNRLADLLRGLSLEPVILSDSPGRGRTIIEKFEQEARSCSFAFVLLTPDDQVRVASPRKIQAMAGPEIIEIEEIDGTTDRYEYAQARPNVVFELGWFYGRLGRQNVCILFRRGTKIHSDLDGVERHEFTDTVEEALPGIQRELRAAGLI